jgi:hypothetical protein
VFMMLIAVAVFLGGGGKCLIDRHLPKERLGRGTGA